MNKVQKATFYFYFSKLGEYSHDKAKLDDISNNNIVLISGFLFVTGQIVLTAALCSQWFLKVVCEGM